MGNPLHPLVRETQAVFSETVRATLNERGMKTVNLADRDQKNKKTVYNVLDLEHPAKLESMAKIAEKLDIPLWMLMIPGLAKHKELLKPGALKPLKAIVENYLASDKDRRIDIEEAGRVSSRLSKPK
jgi:lambda repressor-like predicted transcriptional regulator